MLGEGIALPHSLGLLARRTLVYTVLAPQGMLYDLFLALMNEKASRNLLACRDFNDFKALARAGS